MDMSRVKMAKIEVLKAEYDKREELKYSHPIRHWAIGQHLCFCLWISAKSWKSHLFISLATDMLERMGQPLLLAVYIMNTSLLVILQNWIVFCPHTKGGKNWKKGNTVDLGYNVTEGTREICILYSKINYNYKGGK